MMKAAVVTLIILFGLSAVCTFIMHGGFSLFCMSLFICSMLAVFIGAGGSGRRGISTSQMSSRDLSPFRQMTFADMSGPDQKNVEGNGGILKAGLIGTMISLLIMWFS